MQFPSHWGCLGWSCGDGQPAMVDGSGADDSSAGVGSASVIAFGRRFAHCIFLFALASPIRVGASGGKPRISRFNRSNFSQRSRSMSTAPGSWPVCITSVSSIF